MSEFDEYESLPTASAATHLIAGSMAGVFEHVSMYPVDSIKVATFSLSSADDDTSPGDRCARHSWASSWSQVPPPAGPVPRSGICGCRPWLDICTSHTLSTQFVDNLSQQEGLGFL